MKYSIKFTGTDWLLKIWEPAPLTNNRSLPFLYKIKLRFTTEAEALETLAYYQQCNQPYVRELATA
jgi:hypothetical protein